MSKIQADVKQRYVRDAATYRPGVPYLRNFLSAFFVGGLFCLAGQFFHETFMRQGLDDAEAGARMAVLLVVVGALLTGFGIYDRLGKFSGAGSAVPISGFSNAVTSAAMEHSGEGFVLGTGSQIFTVSGPVLVAGMLSAFVLTIVRMLLVKAVGM